MRLLDEKKQNLVPSSVALTIETTAYALLAALEHEDFEEAKMAVCFLSSKENYGGGFKSTQVSQHQEDHYFWLFPFILFDSRNKRHHIKDSFTTNVIILF